MCITLYVYILYVGTLIYFIMLYTYGIFIIKYMYLLLFNITLTILYS